jgi:hypothetical protein
MLMIMTRVFLTRMRTSEFTEVSQEIYRLAEETKYSYLVDCASEARCYTLLLNGELEAAHEEIHRFLERPTHRLNPIVHRLHTQVASWLGHDDASVFEIEQRVWGVMPGWQSIDAWRAALNGDPERARASLSELDLQENWDKYQVMVLAAALRTAVFVGDEGFCSASLRLLEGAEDFLNYSDVTLLSSLLADAANTTHNAAKARKYYEIAIDSSARFVNRPQLALARLGLGEVLLGHYPDERAAAIEHLDFAISEFREMKMQPALERALRHRGLLKA